MLLYVQPVILSFHYCLSKHLIFLEYLLFSLISSYIPLPCYSNSSWSLNTAANIPINTPGQHASTDDTVNSDHMQIVKWISQWFHCELKITFPFQNCDDDIHYIQCILWQLMVGKSLCSPPILNILNIFPFILNTEYSLLFGMQPYFDPSR
jgi:hypothetical protein